MEWFTLAVGFAGGAVTVMFIPPKYEDFARAWLVKTWKSITE